MGQESLKKEEHLFLYLVNTFKTSAMVALGKMENPMTNELQIALIKKLKSLKRYSKIRILKIITMMTECIVKYF